MQFEQSWQMEAVQRAQRFTPLRPHPQTRAPSSCGDFLKVEPQYLHVSTRADRIEEAKGAPQWAQLLLFNIEQAPLDWMGVKVPRRPSLESGT